MFITDVAAQPVFAILSRIAYVTQETDSATVDMPTHLFLLTRRQSAVATNDYPNSCSPALSAKAASATADLPGRVFTFLPMCLSSFVPCLPSAFLPL